MVSSSHWQTLQSGRHAFGKSCEQCASLPKRRFFEWAVCCVMDGEGGVKWVWCETMCGNPSSNTFILPLCSYQHLFESKHEYAGNYNQDNIDNCNGHGDASELQVLVVFVLSRAFGQVRIVTGIKKTRRQS